MIDGCIKFIRGGQYQLVFCENGLSLPYLVYEKLFDQEPILIAAFCQKGMAIAYMDNIPGTD